MSRICKWSRRWCTSWVAALLHAEVRSKSTEQAEVEVESVAFIVLDALGLASDAYSFPYVARWSSGDDLGLVKTSAEKVITCAKQILQPVDERRPAGGLVRREG